MNTAKNIQDAFLFPLCKSKKEVAIFLKKGVKLTGVIAAFDEYTILLQESTQQLVAKSAIATVMPLEAAANWQSNNF